MPWWNAYDDAKGRLVRGNGFSLEWYAFEEAVRYRCGDRQITLDAREVDRTDELGRTFWVFRTFCVLVTVPSILKWDGGSELTGAETRRVKEQISWALKKIGLRHQYMVDEDFERRMIELEEELKRKYDTDDPWAKR